MSSELTHWNVLRKRSNQSYFMRESTTRFQKFLYNLQDRICSELEAEDTIRFKQDEWMREGGGGGITRVLENGTTFEKAGVNVSAVFGTITEEMESALSIQAHSFYASGLSLVIHPKNPMVPTVHANIRVFELYGKDGSLTDSWFGGGMDLTPYYLFNEDAVHFHSQLKKICDSADSSFYLRFKPWCDTYFFNAHRKEARGIGGIFFDHLKSDKMHSWDELAAFTREVGNGFIPAYIPIVQKRKGLTYTDSQRNFQEIRRGRYVEFNLIHDRGTLFGLKTNGRIESIFMSLPPKVQWVYDYQPQLNSEEYRLIEVLKKPKDWI